MKKIILLILTLSFFLNLSNISLAKNNKVTIIRVMAAYSLKESFDEIKRQFENTHTNIDVEINYAGSQQLVSQIEHGVNADIFACANKEYMEQLNKQGLMVNPKVFAHNKLIIAVSANAKNVNTLNDLVKTHVKLAIAAQTVPIGKYTLELLTNLEKSGTVSPNYRRKYLNNVISNELNVKDVLAKIELEEADAGVVYKTDITREKTNKIRILNINDKYNVTITYSIAILKDSKNKQSAQLFISYILSNEGQKILRNKGFTK